MWKRFMKSHWDTLCACNFFSVEALGITGTVRYMVFFVIEIKSRAVEVVGIAVDPDEAWMKQVARNLTDPVDGFLRGAKSRRPIFFRHWRGRITDSTPSFRGNGRRPISLACSVTSRSSPSRSARR
jgi:hypothetical protein